MVARLPAWFFLSLAMLLMSLALMPLLRVALGIDQQVATPFWNVVMMLIGGLISGLTAMILMVRRQPKLEQFSNKQDADCAFAKKMHACGLLLFTAIPLANFLLCYWLWTKHRHKSEFINRHGQEVLNFQITIYLYLLLSLFMMFAVIGLLTTPLILAFHLIITIIGIVRVDKNNTFFNYPANIPIIQGRNPTEN